MTYKQQKQVLKQLDPKGLNRKLLAKPYQKAEFLQTIAYVRADTLQRDPNSVYRAKKAEQGEIRIDYLAALLASIVVVIIVYLAMRVAHAR